MDPMDKCQKCGGPIQKLNYCRHGMGNACETNHWGCPICEPPLPDQEDPTPPKPAERHTIEQGLFTWGDWDGDHQGMTFYAVVLVAPVGPFPAGKRFHRVHMDYATSSMTLYLFDQDEPVGRFALSLTVGEAL